MTDSESCVLSGVLVCAVAAVPAVRGGEQGRGSCSSPAHPAGAASVLSWPSSALLRRPGRAATGCGEEHNGSQMFGGTRVDFLLNVQVKFISVAFHQQHSFSVSPLTLEMFFR